MKTGGCLTSRVATTAGSPGTCKKRFITNRPEATSVVEENV
jgi:hypothetical protein